MMRITFCKSSDRTTLRLEGKLAGPWVDELEAAWRGVSPTAMAGQLAINLSDVTFVDDDGRKLLAQMCRSGAELTGEGLMTKFTIEKIKQEVSGKKCNGHEAHGDKNHRHHKSGGNHEVTPEF